MSRSKGLPSARGAVDGRLRRTLPRPAYNHLHLNYQRLRTLARRNPGRGRLLPQFVIIGAAKAGTTSLYEWLAQHPFVAPASQKEVHFFDYNYYRSEDWYRRHFPLESERAAFARERGRPFVTGEASPSYMSHYWAPQRLAKLLPTARLIVMLRNPVDRAYSQFQMSRREEEEELASFTEAVAIEDQRLDPERARATSSPHYNSWPIGCWSYLMRSRYAEQLERWFAHFPRDQFHYVTLEGMADNPQRALNGVHRFLALPPHRYDELRPLHTASYDAIAPADRARLTEYFRPHNARLYELLGTDFGWEAASSRPIASPSAAAEPSRPARSESMGV
jgi:Sulfotransferase domain